MISNVTTSCGCTVADWTKEPIAPGKTGIVSSTFDAKAIGRFQKSVGIYCNASNKPIYLAIRQNSRSGVHLTPSFGIRVHP